MIKLVSLFQEGRYVTSYYAKRTSYYNGLLFIHTLEDKKYEWSGDFLMQPIDGRPVIPDIPHYRYSVRINNHLVFYLEDRPNIWVRFWTKFFFGWKYEKIT